jgi:hypothetical protein
MTFYRWTEGAVRAPRRQDPEFAGHPIYWKRGALSLSMR